MSECIMNRHGWLINLVYVYLFLTISIPNKLFCCENMGINHKLQAIQYEKKNYLKLCIF